MWICGCDIEDGVASVSGLIAATSAQIGHKIMLWTAPCNLVSTPADAEG
jgi:hypothetical protein